jgi:hypothetical protein
VLLPGPSGLNLLSPLFSHPITLLFGGFTKTGKDTNPIFNISGSLKTPVSPLANSGSTATVATWNSVTNATKAPEAFS